jgi:hypothetical protein
MRPATASLPGSDGWLCCLVAGDGAVAVDSAAIVARNCRRGGDEHRWCVSADTICGEWGTAPYSAYWMAACAGDGLSDLHRLPVGIHLFCVAFEARFGKQGSQPRIRQSCCGRCTRRMDAGRTGLAHCGGRNGFDSGKCLLHSPFRRRVSLWKTGRQSSCDFR